MRTLFLGNFLLSFHFYLTIYINSTFIAGILGERAVGPLFVAGALLGLLSLSLAPRALFLLGELRGLTIFGLIEVLTLLGLALPTSPLTAAGLLLVHLTMYPIMFFTLDLFLEETTRKEEQTGNIRGIFLTFGNTALIVAPLAVGLILSDSEFWKVFLLSAVLMIPFLLLMGLSFRRFSIPTYPAFHLLSILSSLSNQKDLLRVVWGQFLLRLFYAFMVVYMPLYLHAHIGFSWSQIGFMFTIMLLPFVLFELPAGTLADKILGEKELLIAGFLVLAFFTASASFLTNASFALWTVLLFATRVGASLVEITTESFFFKHVQAADTNSISFFRMAQPIAYVAGVSLAALFLLFLDIQYLFLALGIIIFLGIPFAIPRRDTR